MLTRSRLLIIATSLLMLSLPLKAEDDFNFEYMNSFSGDLTHSSGTVWREALELAVSRDINGDDYICSDPTAIDYWLADQFNQIDPFTLFTLEFWSVFYWTFDAKLVFDNDAEDEYIGANGEHTRRQYKTFKDNKRFWDIFSDDILLMGAHGNIIADDGIMSAFLPLVFNNALPLDIILNAVRASIEGGVVDLTVFDPAWFFYSSGIPGGYDNPLLTLNAVAFSAFGGEIFPGSGIIPDKIIMGEGLLQALTDIGIGHKEGPDYVLSHEFAHHVQFEIGAFEGGPDSPEERTRRTELMADGFAAYYSSHARGNTFQAKRFYEVMTAAFETGDCAFDNPGHHGTHMQRLKASIWGEIITDSAKKKGHINSSGSMLQMFDAALPIILEPDAP